MTALSPCFEGLTNKTIGAGEQLTCKDRVAQCTLLKPIYYRFRIYPSLGALDWARKIL
jgi:hypothetical protein